MQAKNKARVCAWSLLFFVPSLSFPEVFGEALCSPFIPDVTYGIQEEFIPKKGEACWQRSFHKAGREAFKEASDALLFGYLNRTVQQASIIPHLNERRRRWCLNTHNKCSKMWNMMEMSLPVQSELLLPRSPPPAVSSWRGRMGMSLFCWSFLLHCHKLSSLGSLEGGDKKTSDC